MLVGAPAGTKYLTGTSAHREMATTLGDDDRGSPAKLIEHNNNDQFRPGVVRVGTRCGNAEGSSTKKRNS